MKPRTKKRVLLQFTYGAYVWGTRNRDGADHLMFGNYLIQSSFEPPFVTCALSEDSRTLANVKRERAFAVSVVGRGMKSTAQSVLDGSVEGIRLKRSPSGFPVLADSPGWIECRVQRVVPLGDHHVVVAEVVEAGQGPAKKPLPLSGLGWQYGG